tara:strand:+ start:118 stop:1131 length:1014 start_codon:yes stop_codon:yes gene_type:complete
LNAKIKIPKILKNKLRDKKVVRIFNKFEKSLEIKENFIVAVSGGPDSLALAFLAKIYASKNNLKSKFFIVDHKLRPESTREAKYVKKILRKYFIHSEILTWRGLKPSKNILSLARKKRYELLFSQCDKLRINNILLGHHQDDLIENFFIRILRGSGLKGLISLDKKSVIKNKNLYRPLLDQKKEDLIFISNHIFNFFAQDPSNNNEKFQRIRIRNFINKLYENGLDKNKFLKTIKNLKSSNSVINHSVSENIKKNAFFSATKDHFILNETFFHQPYEIIFRSFSRVIQIIGKKYYPVRGKKIDKIINNIRNDQFKRATLGGCIIEKVNQTVIISKEH